MKQRIYMLCLIVGIIAATAVIAQGPMAPENVTMADVNKTLTECGANTAALQLQLNIATRASNEWKARALAAEEKLNPPKVSEAKPPANPPAADKKGN